MSWLLAFLERAERVYGDWLIRFRWYLLLAIVTISLLASLGLSQLTFYPGYRVFINPDNPALLAFDALNDEFIDVDDARIIIAPKSGDVFTLRYLTLVSELTATAWQLPYATRVDSLTNFQHSQASDDELVIEDLVEFPGELSEEDIAEIRDVALNDPDLLRNIISPDGAVTAIHINLKYPSENATYEVQETVTVFNELLAQLNSDYPDVTFYTGGRVIIDEGFFQLAVVDGKTVMPICFVLMLAIFYLLCRSLLCTSISTLVMLLSITSALGLSAYFKLPLTVGNAFTPVIILTIASAGCVHLVMGFLTEISSGQSSKDAVIEALRVNLQPIALTSITTAIGFLSLLLSDIPSFRDMAWMVNLGILAALAYTITLLPILLSFIPSQWLYIDADKTTLHKTFWNKITSFFQRMNPLNSLAPLGAWVVKRFKLCLLASVLLSVLLASGIPKIEITDNFISFPHPKTFMRQSVDFSTEHLTGPYAVQFGLDAGGPGDISEPAFMLEVKKFADWLRAQPEIIAVSSVHDTVQRLNKNMHGDDERYLKIPETRGLIAQYLLLYEMSLPEGLELKNQINSDKSAVRMIATLDAVNAPEMIDFGKRLEKWVKDNTQYLKDTTALGPDTIFADIAMKSTTDMLASTTAALIGISLLLILMLRSVKLGMLSLAPNLIPVIGAFGLWGFVDGEVGLMLSLVMTMTLGIVVDDTVHFMNKYQRARRERGMDTASAIVYSFKTVGRALVVTSVMLSLGFLVLKLAIFQPTADIGVLTAVVILFALITNFFLLPALLMVFDRKTVPYAEPILLAT